MRRGLASLIIGLSLVVASLSWAGFTLSRTVLDPGRSERLADQLLENPDVRQALTIRLADALEAQIPADVAVPRSDIVSGAETALDDPRVEALIRDGFVRVHQNALAGNAEPVTIDANALGAAGRDMLVNARPELDQLLPISPAVEVELPTTGLAWIGSVKNFVNRFTGISAAVALIGAVAAFVVARHRGPVLRRVAVWGYAASAFWLLAGYGIPWLAGSLSPTSAAIAAAAADVFFGAMIQPAVMMAIVASALLLGGFLLPVFERRRGGQATQPRRAAGGGGTAAVPTNSPANVSPANVSPVQTAPVQPPMDQTMVQPTPSQRPHGDPRVQPQPQPQRDSVLWDSAAPKNNTDQMPTPTWADGHGSPQR